ncbi:hypothetical protein GCM10009765_06960 [Fodinicola feengrottensis]|uniref:Secreted protein n=1 Tax=Fodinicola feengrottensis TaxID=435914 RepID=A0ABN2FW88_9ACTN
MLSGTAPAVFACVVQLLAPAMPTRAGAAEAAVPAAGTTARAIAPITLTRKMARLFTCVSCRSKEQLNQAEKRHRAAARERATKMLVSRRCKIDSRRARVKGT